MEGERAVHVPVLLREVVALFGRSAAGRSSTRRSASAGMRRPCSRRRPACASSESTATPRRSPSRESGLPASATASSPWRAATRTSPRTSTALGIARGGRRPGGPRRLVDAARPRRAGFSFLKDGPLDMRMDRTARPPRTRGTASREELTRIFREYGEERMAGPIARGIVEARETAPIRTTGEMRRLVSGRSGRAGEAKDPATRVFQALRIARTASSSSSSAFSTTRSRASRSARDSRSSRTTRSRTASSSTPSPPHGRLHVPAVVPRVRLPASPRDGARHEEGRSAPRSPSRREPARPLGAPPRPGARRRGDRPAPPPR